MDSAQISFCYREEELGGISEDDLMIFWVDPDNRRLVPLGDEQVTIDRQNNVITGTTDHFSIYLLGQKHMQVDLPNVDIVFAIDQSGSMSSSDSNYYRLMAVKRFVQDIDKLHFRAGIVSLKVPARLDKN